MATITEIEAQGFEKISEFGGFYLPRSLGGPLPCLHDKIPYYAWGVLDANAGFRPGSVLATREQHISPRAIQYLPLGEVEFIPLGNARRKKQ